MSQANVFRIAVLIAWTAILVIGFTPPTDDQPLSHDASAFLVWVALTTMCSIGTGSRFWGDVQPPMFLVRRALWFTIGAVLTNIALLSLLRADDVYGPMAAVTGLSGVSVFASLIVAPIALTVGFKRRAGGK